MTKIALNPTTRKPWLGYADRDRNVTGRAWQRNPWGVAPADAAATWGADGISFAAALDSVGAPRGFETRPRCTERTTPDAQGKRALPLTDGSRAVVALGADGTECALAVVGSAYTVVGERHVASVLDGIGLRADSAAFLDDGRRWYLQSLPTHDAVRPGPTGNVRSSIFVEGSHDGSTPVRGGSVTVAIVCANTLKKARAEALASALALAVRHRSGATAAVTSWGEALAAAESERRAFLDLARRAAETQATSDGVDALLQVAFPGHSRAPATAVARVRDILNDANPSTGVAGDGSLLDVLQALTYWTSHERGVRGDKSLRDAARYVGDMPAGVDAAWGLVAQAVSA